MIFVDSLIAQSDFGFRHRILWILNFNITVWRVWPCLCLWITYQRTILRFGFFTILLRNERSMRSTMKRSVHVQLESNLSSCVHTPKFYLFSAETKVPFSYKDIFGHGYGISLLNQFEKTLLYFTPPHEFFSKSIKNPLSQYCFLP